MSRILIVDDEPLFRRVLGFALHDHGYQVSDVSSGQEAVDTIRVEVPDLILLDLNMPGMDGLQTCRAIRACSAVPIIILSARQSPQDRLAASRAGADGYLPKPFALDELLARVEKFTRKDAARGK